MHAVSRQSSPDPVVHPMACWRPSIHLTERGHLLLVSLCHLHTRACRQVFLLARSPSPWQLQFYLFHQLRRTPTSAASGLQFEHISCPVACHAAARKVIGHTSTSVDAGTWPQKKLPVYFSFSRHVWRTTASSATIQESCFIFFTFFSWKETKLIRDMICDGRLTSR
jgi:hypothetical protein